MEGHIKVTVTLGKQSSSHQVDPDKTLADFFTDDLSIGPDSDSLFKVIVKGHTLHMPGPDSQSALHHLGIVDGSRILVVKSSIKAIETLAAEGEYERRRAAARANARTVKVRDTSDRTLNPYSFGQIVPLPASPIAPFFEERQAMLEQLANDPAIKAVMKEMELSVGVLGELHPHIDPTILGVNENAGQRIRLRLLTDRLDGLRSYKSMVRRVLCHELAHNRFGPHDNDFKELDSRIVKTVVAHEAAARSSGHRLGGEMGDHYEPPEEIEAACSTSAKTPVGGSAEALSRVSAMIHGRLAGQGNVLGGGTAPADDDRRRAAADAAMRRARDGPSGHQQ